jgi:serine/threonine protein kinase
VDDSQISISDNTSFLAIPGKVGRTIKPGEVLGDNYELTALLGHGGMGVVYRCRHRIIGREYALKILSPHQVNASSWQRFEVEGKVIAKLDHPNIVKIYNMGVYENECPFYVMELLFGPTLEDYLDNNGPLDRDRAIDLFQRLAAALSYAHAKGIVHRDIKPSNIILPESFADNGQINLHKTAPGQTFADIKIVDFGLAKLTNKQTQAGQSLTTVGEIFGSPLYMSPEQGNGSEVDERSDIYSLGCTFYKTLTGKPPFHGESSFATILQHQQTPAPTLAQGNTRVSFDAELEAVVQKMLAKLPENRYQSMSQLLHDLNRLAEGKSLAKSGLFNESPESLDSEYQEWQRKNRESKLRTILVVAALSLAVVGFGYWAVDSTRHGRSPFGTLFDKPKRAPLAAPRGITTVVGMIHGKPVEDPADAKALIAFQRFESKPTIIQPKNGRLEKVIFCPDEAIGNLTTPFGFRQAATKTVVIPYHNFDTTLQLKVSNHRFTFHYPWILKRIDPTAINGLILDHESYLKVFNLETSPQSASADKVLAILNNVEQWKYLLRLEMREFFIDQSVLDKIDKISTLNSLAIKFTPSSAKLLTGHKVFDQISYLDLTGLKDVDSFLHGLGEANHLKALVIDRTSPSARALAELKKCPNLTELNVEQISLTSGQLEALDHLTRLRKLSLRKNKIDPNQLLALKNFSHLEVLIVSEQSWPAFQVARIKKQIPGLLILGEHGFSAFEESDNF